MIENWQQQMGSALELAKQAAAEGEVPVGAVLCNSQGEIVASAYNQREQLSDPTAHAEVLLIRAFAKSLASWNLSDYTLVVTLEPCLLCAATIQAARISRVVFGAYEPKTGALGSVHDPLRDRRQPYRTEIISGVLAEESAKLMAAFFEAKR